MCQWPIYRIIGKAILESESSCYILNPFNKLSEWYLKASNYPRLEVVPEIGLNQGARVWLLKVVHTQEGWEVVSFYNNLYNMKGGN